MDKGIMHTILYCMNIVIKIDVIKNAAETQKPNAYFFYFSVSYVLFCYIFSLAKMLSFANKSCTPNNFYHSVTRQILQDQNRNLHVLYTPTCAHLFTELSYADILLIYFPKFITTFFFIVF